ncbi:hypothetical protein O1611_g1210 [Lasiodiplodia mahajangana]|uniref:Uncharacterized protein n=1 Tax=Lasiodiplodia mahajangana TaxID=1108764 RepID=A0ACC2JYB5_9PEZI|nr:hypothetical protein O1611_g1210 [Lasiodiplodia mahajangana]
MASRESIDSTGSAAPLISGPFFQPPPSDYPHNHDKAVGKGNDAATKVGFSAFIMAFRLLALISGLAIGVSFAILGAWRIVTILLIVLTWVSAAWNAIMLIVLIRTPSLRVSLVLGNGRIIRLGAQNEGDGQGKRRRCSPRVFWIDLLLVAALIAFNIAQGVTGASYYRTTVALNWFTIAFNIIITVLAMFPASAHVRLETAEMPQISLP